jgi:type II secretion system protein N
MNRRVLLYACGIPAAVLCFLWLTLMFTPNDAVKGLLVRVADNAGYTLDLTGFGKSFPIGVKAKGVELSTEQGALLKLRDARLRLKLLPLLLGKVEVGYTGTIGGGELSGEVTLGKAGGWEVQCRGVHLEEIPFFSTVAGARVRGELRLNGKLAKQKGVDHGELQLEVRGAELAGVKLGGMPLPDAAYKTVRGALRIDQGRAELKSFSLDGDGVYVRLKGDSVLGTPVGSSPLNLTMEMMPKPAFMERQKLIFLLLMKYQSSPGAYSVPIHGTLAHPSM